MTKIDGKTFKSRVQSLMRQELHEPERFMWFSFAEEKSAGGFKGAVIIKAHGITDGLMKINLLGINPGGEVFAVDIPEDAAEMCTSDVINRLLSKEEIDTKWGAMTLDEWDESQRKPS